MKEQTNNTILYISGSFPRLGDGIGDAAGKLYDSMCKTEDIELITSEIPSICNYIKECSYDNYTLVSNWKIKSINVILKKIRNGHIKKVLVEYAGNGYGRDLAISFLPLWIRINNLFSKEKVQCHLRLHEFTMCRPARKIFTYPLVWFCHHLDTPSYVEYKALSKKYGAKVHKSAIGSNIQWRNDQKAFDKNVTDKIKLAFFGGIYPGKGIEKLIKMWGEIERKYPETYEYQLLGGFPENLTNVFDEYQVSIRELIKKEGLESKILISGFLPEEEIVKWLDGVDIAVLPYEDGLTLRRGSFLAFLGRGVAVVTSNGDEEARELFAGAKGVKMCSDGEAMIKAIRDYTEDNSYYEAGLDNAKFQKNFEWDKIAQMVTRYFNI